MKERKVRPGRGEDDEVVACDAATAACDDSRPPPPPPIECLRIRRAAGEVHANMQTTPRPCSLSSISLPTLCASFTLFLYHLAEPTGDAPVVSLVWTSDDAL